MPSSKTYTRHKQHLSDEQKGLCYYCGVEVALDDGCVDHKIAKIRGGTNKIDNLCFTCWSCNATKSDATIETFRIRVAIRKSMYHGVLNSSQFLELVSLGVKLEIEHHVFWFEKVKMNEASINS